jgi:pimeloyl-ACP methyl ester carboxylesterase
MRSRLMLLGILVLVVTACQTPATPTLPPPTETPLPPPTATTTPKLKEGLVKIPSANGPTIDAEVKGGGDTVVVFANMSDNYSGVWLKLINALDNSKFRTVVFSYTNPETDAAHADIDAVLKFLEQHGVNRIICVGASLGTRACTHVAQHPAMIGQVFMAGPLSGSLAEAKYPKLFVVAENDGNFAASTQAMYDEAAEPKTIKIFSGYAHGAAMFLDNSLDTAQYIADFLNNLP